ncbi:tetratricopeptide repeat protein [Hanstruepera ponticola]|uniref:tetratricopeptide repeat protein n=1 Tax=Hanstruepera ponticola TaxID=2042995 RepID=UPI00177A9A15|nr:tetratricopeptide repeat protein [Hanstruepera ponticola]
MKIVLTLFFTLNVLIAFSQENESDLLKKHNLFFTNTKETLNNIKSNDSILNYLSALEKQTNNDYLINRLKIIKAGYYKSINLTKTFALLDEVNPFLDEHPNFRHLKIHYNIIKGKALYESGKFKESIEIYLENKNELKNLKMPEDLWRFEIETKTGIISNYVVLNKDKEAIDLLKELEKTVSLEKEIDEYVYVLNLLGYLHVKSKNYNEGIVYYNEIINILKDNTDYKETYLGACNNLAYIYQLTNNNEKALEILEKALDLTIRLKMTNRELLLSNNLGFLYIKENQLSRAEELGLKVLSKSTEKFEEKKADAQRLLANVYYHQGKYEEALTNCNNAAVYFKKLNDLKRLKGVLSIKNKILIKTNQFEEATKVNSEMISIMDSISITSDMQNLQKTLVAFETEKKDNEITILKQQEEINNFKIHQQKEQIKYLGLALITILIFSSIILLYQKKINTIKNLSLRSKLTRSQFNPHYINNAFTSLQAELIERDFDESLIDYTSNISRFSRSLLESTFKDEWTLFEEKQMMENYLKTQQYRLQNSFYYSIETNIKVEELHKLKIPSAITQSVLENAIEHGGFNNIDTNGFITILINRTNDIINISIKNNILGQLVSINKKLDHDTSRGLDITKQRIALHSKIYKKIADFKFYKTDNEAIVEFKLPLVAA